MSEESLVARLGLARAVIDLAVEVAGVACLAAIAYQIAFAAFDGDESAVREWVMAGLLLLIAMEARDITKAIRALSPSTKDERHER